MAETLHEKLSELEALLFVHGEPLALQKIGTLLHLSGEEVPALLKELELRLENDERGLTLLQDDLKVQLVTKPRWREMLERFVKEELTDHLTPASLETLSLVLYLGPMARDRIEYFRGVNSLFTLRTLRMRGLVDRIPNPASPQSFLYRPSFELLKHVGVTKQTELPDFEKFRTLLEQSETLPLTAAESP